MKKDMLSKWDHLDWNSMVPEELEMDNGVGSMDKISVENHRHHRSSESDSQCSPTSDLHKLSKSETDLEDSGDSLGVNNCHIGMRIIK